MGKRKQTISFTAVLIAIAAIGGFVFLWPAAASDARDAPLADATYHVDKIRADHEYEVVVNEFVRYGPLRVQIESDLGSTLGPERSRHTTTWAIGPTGAVSRLAFSRGPRDGEPWFTTVVSPTRRTTLDHRQRTVTFASATGPEAVSALEERREAIFPRNNVGEALALDGWANVGTDVFRERVVTVWETIDAAPAVSERPPLPYVADLNPVELRGEIVIDQSSGIVLQNSTYAVSSTGAETLIQRFTVLSFKQSPLAGTSELDG